MANPRNNPTFNKSNNNGLFPGFYSRALFSYAPYGGNVPNLYNANSSQWINANTYDGIRGIMSSVPEMCHGSNELPAKYWCPGKTIRLTGDFSVNASNPSIILGSAVFNLLFGLKEMGTNGVTILARTNDSNDHTLSGFADFGGDIYYLPIHFECTIVCAIIDTENDETIFYTNGFYYYDRVNWNDAGTNFNKNSVVYVPVWETANGSTTISGLSYYNNPTRIIMNGYGSALNGDDGNGQIFLSKLLIEELA
jgi:hypothetical protein